MKFGISSTGYSPHVYFDKFHGDISEFEQILFFFTSPAKNKSTDYGHLIDVLLTLFRGRKYAQIQQLIIYGITLMNRPYLAININRADQFGTRGFG